MNSPAPSSLKGQVAKGLKRRYRNERIFRMLGLGAVIVGLAFLGFFFFTLIGNGYTAFEQTRFLLDVDLAAAAIDPDGTRDPEILARANYQGLARNAVDALFPEVTERRERRELYAMLSAGAGFELRDRVLGNPDLIGTTQSLWLLADDDVDMVFKGHVSRGADGGARLSNLETSSCAFW